MVEVMKIIATSFKRSHAGTATLSALDLAAGHHRSTSLPETPRHSWASLGQSLVGSLLLSSGSWCAQSFVCALQESVSQSCVSSVIKSTGLQSQIPWGFSVPVSDLQVEKSIVDPRTFLTV